MENNYNKLIQLLEERQSITSQEQQDLSQLVQVSQQSSNTKYETELFQNIAKYLGNLIHTKYTIKKRSASGGFAHTAIVQNKTNNQLYLMKYLHKEKTKLTEYRERFIREIINTLAIEHAHVPRLVYFGKSSFSQDEDEYFYIMDHIQGKEFYSYIFEEETQEWKQNQEELIYAYTNILEAMNFLHSKAIYHRDCTLPNMMYDPKQKKAYLIDLGLAKQFEDNIAITEPTAFHGNPAYTAPELLLGNPCSISSDIYTLGASLYSLITRKYPHNFCTTNMETMNSQIRTWLHQEKTCLTLSDLEGSDYTLFSSVVENSTAFDPAQRYKTLKQFLNDYKKAIDNLNIIKELF